MVAAEGEVEGLGGEVVQGDEGFEPVLQLRQRRPGPAPAVRLPIRTLRQRALATSARISSGAKRVWPSRKASAASLPGSAVMTFTASEASTTEDQRLSRSSRIISAAVGSPGCQGATLGADDAERLQRLLPPVSRGMAEDVADLRLQAATMRGGHGFQPGHDGVVEVADEKLGHGPPRLLSA